MSESRRRPWRLDGRNDRGFDIFLLQSVLTYFNVSTLRPADRVWIIILVASISLNGLTGMIERRKAR